MLIHFGDWRQRGCVSDSQRRPIDSRAIQRLGKLLNERNYETARDGRRHALKERAGGKYKKKVHSLVLFGVLLCSSFRVFAVHIVTDYDHSANFSQYKTYSWPKVQAGDSLWADRIQHDVDAQLAAKGWTRVDANGNATVAAFQSTQDQQTLETFYDGFGGGWRWRGGGRL
jgi:hypothetical protein